MLIATRLSSKISFTSRSTPKFFEKRTRNDDEEIEWKSGREERGRRRAMDKESIKIAADEYLPHLNSEHASRYRFESDGSFQSKISEKIKFSSVKHSIKFSGSLSIKVAPSAVLSFSSGRMPFKLNVIIYEMRIRAEEIRRRRKSLPVITPCGFLN